MIDPAEHVGLVFTIAREYERRFRQTPGEYVAVAYMAVAEAARRYDPGSGKPFSVLAGIVIRSRILDAWRRERHRAMVRVTHDRGRASAELGRVDAHDHARLILRRATDRPLDVLQMLARGVKRTHIAGVLRVSAATLNRDLEPVRS